MTTLNLRRVTGNTRFVTFVRACAAGSADLRVQGFDEMRARSAAMRSANHG